MNPVRQIGRYKLPILNVAAIKGRDKRGWRRYAFWRVPGYDVLLTNGSRIHFTEEEKEAYDKALDEHELVLQIYGACRGAGLRA